ncbi:hypothetical protein AB0284_05875 [Pseudarthrobacter phenanthrenivorans]|uniref:hypothetical protein n=1 Tax=Pseudarthrobacter phenanthrenivorans TaxID=361575 RepID=UPI00344C9ECF
MSDWNHRRFLSECIMPAPGKQHGLGEDEMYGVYVSWCLINAQQPASATALRAAVAREGHRRHHIGGRSEWRDITMTGPAAVDYILSSQPSLV